MNYYNDHDPKICAWLRELIAAGLIPDGIVDERSILDIEPGELAGFTQVHLFAGVGGWASALQLAGVAADVRLWTGSCPCQPLSCAGKGLGEADERHLWPAFARLIRECSPPIVLGENVASKDGREWFAGIRLDLEAMGYAVGGADLCAAGVGAPHIRQRLYWVADANSGRHGTINARADQWAVSEANGGDLRMGNAPSDDQRRQRQSGAGSGREGEVGGSGGGTERLADRERERLEGRDDTRTGAGAQCETAERSGNACGEEHSPLPQGQRLGQLGIELPRPADFWSDSTPILCRDGKLRRVPAQSVFLRMANGISEGLDASGDAGDGFPLAEKVEGRVGLLRGYGNAIVPQVAAEFIKAFLSIP